MKVYPRLFSNNGSPLALPPLIVAGSTMECFQIPFPSEGSVAKLVVWQVPAAGGGGTPCAFNVELLNSQIPYPLSGNPYAVGATPADLLPAYRIQMPSTGPLAQATPGAALTLDDDNVGFPFHNLDGNFANNQRFIYLLISPVGAGGQTVWNVFLLARTNVGVP
jgi:hypothetical protein